MNRPQKKEHKLKDLLILTSLSSLPNLKEMAWVSIRFTVKLVRSLLGL